MLLNSLDGSPVAIENSDARGDFLFVCEHACNRLPQSLGTLGLSPEGLESHIAWDPGALAVAQMLSRKLDGTLIYQRFSRLAYDCNRPPDSPAAMPTVSEVYAIPGNCELPDDERQARIDEIYSPFRNAVAEFVRSRQSAGRSPVLITIHSFTPTYFGKPRAVELGILHDSDRRLADQMLKLLTLDEAPYVIRRNEPYGPDDGVTHSLVEYGVKLGLANAMLEISNALVCTKKGQRSVASFLAALLKKCAEAPIPPTNARIR
ncbi:N-formylglutamate amidohydrolase [Ensifer sp. ENS04]|uniref:N-formylglutamate amidohydrolase n=1 Tax=Ensifer sp. ENS04 TaxID=2769281 RepID=UPI0017826665|nr:N-formylglutamate amidohydrolase [Ensifer sp. ENS04]MBD9541461.1 N-formylglutamate amidohydrolase [Ensifer sp. ENS04]